MPIAEGGLQAQHPLRATAWPLARACLPALLVSSLATLWCAWASGAGLGLFLGAILLLAIYAPPLVLAEESWNRWVAAAVCVAGVSIVLACSTAWVDVTAGEWFRCCLVLGAFAFGLAGLAVIWESMGCPPPLAAALTVLPGLLWLTWPVWLSPWMTQSLANWLVPANPLLAINSAVAHLGTWDRAPLAYRALTVLNQDVPYRLPVTIVPALLLHLALGMPGAVLTLRATGRGRRSEAEARADEAAG